VKNHLARIGRKLGVGDRAQMVAIACRAGLIPLASPGSRMT
jgi:DNA-binding NarL/FixJ family response regulator